MAPGLAGIIVYEAPTDGIANSILNRMATDNLAKQLSCSWDFPTPTAGSTDQIFQQMAVQGQSFFNASGDWGAYKTSIPPPDDDPYITLVGGTTLTTDFGGAWASERVWNWNASGQGDGASGGGISDSYDLPDWQTGISTSANRASTLHRNLPDVAMIADNVWVAYNSGASGSFGGTSCAAPLWAGFTALVNEQATLAGDSSVGFLNPALYAIGKSSTYSSAFHDITIGNNSTNSVPSEYPATSGYDLCTGWGTPTGQALIDVLTGPPDPLRIAPATGFAATGPVGGPFNVTSQVFALTNTGAAALDWAVASTAPWLTGAPVSGNLGPAAPSTTVTISLNRVASELAAGVYQGSLEFTNLTTGAARIAHFSLAVGQNVVQNGGFESGSLTNWTLQGNALDTHVVGSGSLPAHPELIRSGAYGALLGEISDLGYLSQTLTTIPGQFYLVSFWVASPYFSSTDAPNEFQVAWTAAPNPTTVLFDQADLAPFNWTNMLFVASAPGSSAFLQFGARNDPQAFGLDDVSAVPFSPPKLQAVTAVNGAVTFTWATVPGLAYQAQYTTNLAGGGWTNVGSPLAATSATLTLSEAQPPDQRRFYRIVLSQ